MTSFLLVLLLFILAFTGLSTGLLIRGKGISGGCGSASSSGHNCQCSATTTKTIKVIVKPRT
jgi:hypothetical protein